MGSRTTSTSSPKGIDRPQEGVDKLTDDTRPYDLRKAFVTRLMASGADLKTVMALSGHTQVNILVKHYAQVVPERQKEALGKMKLG